MDIPLLLLEICLATIGVCVFRCVDLGWRTFYIIGGKTMKHTVSLILILCLLLALVACGTSTSQSESGPITEAASKTGDDVSENPEKIYTSACEKLLKGDINEAYEMLKEIRDYAPAAERLKGFFYLPSIVVEKTKYADDQDFMASTNIYTYNSDGNVIKINDKEYAYNANGNVISGGDLLYNDYGNIMFTYDNGNLISIKGNDKTITYEYNEKGLVSKETIDYGDTQPSERVYEYTYYEDGSVKTMTVGDTNTLSFDLNGRILEYRDDWAELDLTITHGLYGIKEIHNKDGYEKLDFSYTYDDSGALTKFEAKYYEDGRLYTEFEYVFTDNKLFYSENPNVIARAAIITLQDIEAVLDVVG